MFTNRIVLRIPPLIIIPLFLSMGLSDVAHAAYLASPAFVFPADVQELVTRVTFCSALVRSLNEKGDENGADEVYGRTCISDETLEAAILRIREAHKDSPEIQLLLNNLPPYKD